MTTAKQRSFRWKVILAFALVYTLWGSTYLGIRIAVESVPPAMMGAIRFLIAGGLMLIWCAATGRTIRVTRDQFRRLLIIGILLLTTGNVVLGWAEQNIPTGLAALIIAITPVWFLLLETFVFRGDHLSRRGIAGLAMGFLGIVVLLWPKIANGGSLGKQQLFGACLVLGSSFSWATGSVLSKQWHMPVDPYVASAWEMTLAGIVNLVVALALGNHHETAWQTRSLLAILYLVIAGSWVGFTAYIWLLRNVPTSKVATYAYVNPIVAVFLGWLVLDEKIDAFILAGTAIIIVGVATVTGAKIRKREVAPEELPAVETTG